MHIQCAYCILHYIDVALLALDVHRVLLSYRCFFSVAIQFAPQPTWNSFKKTGWLTDICPKIADFGPPKTGMRLRLLGYQAVQFEYFFSPVLKGLWDENCYLKKKGEKTASHVVVLLVELNSDSQIVNTMSHILNWPKPEHAWKGAVQF